MEYFSNEEWDLGTIKVPYDNPAHILNTSLRVLSIIIYLIFLAFTLYNIAAYIVIKKRYKDFSVVTYYVFFVGLFLSRLCAFCIEFKYVMNPTIKQFIVASDGCSVCIGLAQVALIGDLIITL